MALLCDLKRSEPGFFRQFEEETNALIDQAMAGKCRTEVGEGPDTTGTIPERAQPDRAQPERAQPEQRTRPASRSRALR